MLATERGIQGTDFTLSVMNQSINQEILETIRQHVIPMLFCPRVTKCKNQSQQHNNIVTVIFHVVHCFRKWQL